MLRTADSPEPPNHIINGSFEAGCPSPWWCTPYQAQVAVTPGAPRDVLGVQISHQQVTVLGEPCIVGLAIDDHVAIARLLQPGEGVGLCVVDGAGARLHEASTLELELAGIEAWAARIVAARVAWSMTMTSVKLSPFTGRSTGSSSSERRCAARRATLARPRKLTRVPSSTATVPPRSSRSLAAAPV